MFLGENKLFRSCEPMHPDPHELARIIIISSLVTFPNHPPQRGDYGDIVVLETRCHQHGVTHKESLVGDRPGNDGPCRGLLSIRRWSVSDQGGVEIGYSWFIGFFW